MKIQTRKIAIRSLYSCIHNICMRKTTERGRHDRACGSTIDGRSLSSKERSNSFTCMDLCFKGWVKERILYNLILHFGVLNFVCIHTP